MIADDGMGDVVLAMPRPTKNTIKHNVLGPQQKAKQNLKMNRWLVLNSFVVPICT